jgi:hypothetical protein
VRGAIVRLCPDIRSKEDIQARELVTPVNFVAHLVPSVMRDKSISTMSGIRNEAGSLYLLLMLVHHTGDDVDERLV